MLDATLVTQLKTTFERLDAPVGLAVRPSIHPRQSELLDLLDAVCATSAHLSYTITGDSSPVPHVSLGNIGFIGIPSGHEFSSLILAILQVSKKAKAPDAIFLDRIKNIKTPWELRTFISLSCTTCPDVVQALNTIAAYNPIISHTMIDGGFMPEEVERLGLQGVPAVMSGDTIVSSGRATLEMLLNVLDTTNQTDATSDADAEPAPIVTRAPYTPDVVVLGGGPAGLSSAIYTIRKGLKTMVITDHIGGQLKDTLGIENFISVPYTEGKTLISNLIEHTSQYPIEILENRSVKKVDTDKTVHLSTGETITPKAVIVATGARWKTLNIPGESQYTGNGVAFCPHCDGPFYKNRPVAVIGGGNSGVEAALDLAGIVSHLTLVEYAPTLKADAILVDKLKKLSHVKIITNAQLFEITGDGKKVTGMTYKDRETEEVHTVSVDGIFIQIGLAPNSAFVKDSVACNPYGEIITDDRCQTSIPGIFATGDVSAIPYKQIIVAMGSGATAGMASATYIMENQ